MFITAAMILTAYPSHHGRRERSSPNKQGNDMTYLNNEVSELSIDELDAVSGGNVVDTAVQVLKAAAQVVTGTVGVCTDHWYSS